LLNRPLADFHRRNRPSLALASTVETDDARVLMQLMRHTSPTTTTKYLRAMHERMRAAVSGLGKNPSGKFLGENVGESQNALRGQKKCRKQQFTENERMVEK
jgi:hypothetical protein